MTTANTSDFELKDRYEYLLKKYLEIITPLTKQLEEFGRTRNELELIVEEFKKRGLSYSDIDKKYELEKKKDQPT